eukprot:2808875-Rhodomonas_salina.2
MFAAPGMRCAQLGLVDFAVQALWTVKQQHCQDSGCVDYYSMVGCGFEWLGKISGGAVKSCTGAHLSLASASNSLSAISSTPLSPRMSIKSAPPQKFQLRVMTDDDDGGG